MRDRIAAQWWSQALHQYRDLYHTVTAEGVAVVSLPSVNEKQVELFEATLYQQLSQQQPSKTRRKSGKISKRKQNGSHCETVLFADASGLCDELAQAAQTAGIQGLQQMLPEHTAMIIYADQVQVGSEINAGAWHVIWSAQEETMLQNTLKELSRYLGFAETKLRLMVDTGHLKIQQHGKHLQFTCDGITATVMNEHP